MVKISVIIPSFNSAKYLKKTINSIYKQSLDDIETICIDDGSTDNTLEILNSLKEKYPSLKIISQENQGPGKARNVGIKSAKGKYVAFLDSDDILVDINALEKMYNLAEKKNLNMVSANLTFVNKKYKIKRENHHYESGDYLYFDKYGTINVEDYGIPYGFTKAIFNLDFLLSNNIYFPEYATGEDPIFLAKVFVNLSKIGTVPLVLYGYNHTVGGGVNKKINTYHKKKQYINHFKIVCDILTKGNLQNIADQYKIHLFKYLNWSKNVSDVDLFRIFNEIYSDVSSNYFDENDDDYKKFMISYKFYFLKHSQSNQLFNSIKNEISKYDVEFINNIQLITIKRYLLIMNSSSLSDFNFNCCQFELKRLENQKEQLKNKNKYLHDEKNELHKKSEKLKEFNKDLMNSSSWKLTKPLRSVKKLMK